MRGLGIDYGTRRLGLAVSDEDEIVANALPMLRRTRSLNRDLMALRSLIRDREIEWIVVGLPLNMDGSRGDMARSAEAFAEELRKRIRLPVTCYDERNTTQEAERVLLEADLSRKRRKGLRDSMAAMFILQAYLDDHRGPH
jgi:putative Holliday junction resolvase